MIYRAIDTKLYGPINIGAATEEEFLRRNKGYIAVEKDELPGYPSWLPHGYYMLDGDKIVLDAERMQQLIVDTAKRTVEHHIYASYPQQKQTQDQSWKSYAEAAIVAIAAQMGQPITIDQLGIEITGTVLAVMAGNTTIADYVASKPEPMREHYEKLLRVGIRLKWAKNCIDEMKAALAENRAPDYPAYPAEILV